MVCSICQESYFKAAAGPSGGRRPTNATAGGSAAHRPAALGCGHAFHKQCIEEWFENDYSKSCPQCKVSHRGPVTILYIDMDEEDYDASKKSKVRFSNNRSDDEMKQLAQKMLSMNIQDKSAEYYMIGSLIAQIAELKQGNALSQRHKAELAEARLKAENERKRADKAEDELDDLKIDIAHKESSLVYFRNEVNRLNVLSDRHRDHINALNRNVEARKEMIRELAEKAESDQEKIDWYESEYGERHWW
ncbi:hypothetical protein GGI19_000190 [Coemansia pectinata]|uniref:RING-type domain-containing protein n=1 Tax=Coemansia pectinata TaxID=1052879 RepID=A0A9W8LCF4_9FUNG|nr:hypothetical protein GGI19_000190 [Coemansia pectinata]